MDMGCLSSTLFTKIEKETNIFRNLRILAVSVFVLIEMRILTGDLPSHLIYTYLHRPCLLLDRPKIEEC